MMKLTMPIEYQFVKIGVIAFLAVLVAGWNVARGRALGRRAAAVIGVGWVACLTAEYWLFGPYSAVGRPDEYHASIPLLLYKVIVHDGGTFAHAYAGGLDAGAGLGMGSQVISFEYFVVRTLPLWLALLALNAGAIGLAFAGAYRVARAMDVSRGKAVIVGMVASGTQYYLFDQAAGGIGWSVAVVPGAFHLIVQRAARRQYYFPIAAIAVLVPGPVHTLPGVTLAILLAAWLLPPPNFTRAVRGFALFIGVVIVNWLRWFLAFAAIAPDNARLTVVQTKLSLWDILSANHDAVALPVASVCVVLLALRRDRFAIKGAVALAIGVGLGPALSWIDWASTGIPFASTYRWYLLADDYVLIAIVLLSRTLAGFRWERSPSIIGFRLPPLSAAYFGAVAVFAAADHKAFNVVNLTGYGGQALYTDARCIADASWRPPEPFRVVTVPNLISPSTISVYGLHTLDGQSMFVARSGAYFGLAVQQPPNPNQNVQYHWLNVPNGATALAPTVNLTGLRIANVRFVISDRKLEDPELRLVADCSDQPMRSNNALTRWTARIAPGALVRPHYIYELAHAWPRVFAPSTVRVSAAAPMDPAFFTELLAAPWPPAAQIAESDLARAGIDLPAGSVDVSGYAVVPSGFDITVRPGASPGLVVVNAPYSRFWQALAGDRALRVVPVNGAQFGVVVDGGAAQISVRYRPPRPLG